MGNDKDNSGDILMIIAFFVIIMALIMWGYSVNSATINAVIIQINRAHLFVFSYLPGSAGTKAAYVYEGLATIHPANFTFTQMMAQVAFVGTYVRWLVLLILGLFVTWGFMSKMVVSEYYRRFLNMETLIKQNVEEFPCMAPIANRKRSILEEPLDEGPWATVRKPIQWVQENGLLLDKNGNVVSKKDLIDKHGLPNLFSKLLKKNNNKDIRIDEVLAEKKFIEHLGPKFSSFEDLPDYQRGLVAAFLAYGVADKDSAFSLLNQMSLSFVEPEEGWEKFEIDITGADELIKKYKEDDMFRIFTDAHKTYSYVYIMAIFEKFARKKGVLSTSQFIWLRPINRTLWYSLNQMGGREAWPEGAGSWAHYYAEDIVDETIEVPKVKTAIIGLKIALRRKGWLAINKNDDFDV